VNGRIGLVQMGADQTVLVASMQGGTTVSFEGPAGNRRLTGIADGTASDDAATVGQVQRGDAATLQAAADYTDATFSQVFLDLDEVFTLVSDNERELRREIDRAAAGSAALAGLPQPTLAGRSFVAAALGGQGDQVSFALGLGYMFDRDNAPSVRAAVAFDPDSGRGTYNVGAGIHF